MSIDLSSIHKKRQDKRDESHIYKTHEGGNKPKHYILDMFPYASGAGLHVGHPKGYIATDVLSRKKRLEGHNVLHPMGFDAFGLPTEQFAIKNKKNPKEVTEECIVNFKEQLRSIGFDYDWDRSLSTTDPEFYTWTQRIFNQLYTHWYDHDACTAKPISELESLISSGKIHLPDTVSVSGFVDSKRLAYVDYQDVNWCPTCKTGLANEDLEDGACERCSTPIERRPMKQWMLRITDYAERLLTGLDELPDWPNSVKEMQRNWIGKKEGINIHYPILGTQEEVECFTTRPDTNFGATFIVLAPEHNFVTKILRKEIKVDAKTYESIAKYVEEAKNKSTIEREAEGRKKTGVFTGFYADHRLMNGVKIPLWISDFVLAGFGTGAVVGVPGHDLRDFEFATTFDLPIIRVVVGPDGDTSPITDAAQVQEEVGTMTNSQFLDGMDIHAATQAIMDHYEQQGRGERIVNYRLQERVFSRQRYRGEPIPVVWTKDEKHSRFVEVMKSLGREACIDPKIEQDRHAKFETTDDGFVEVVCGVSTNDQGEYLMIHQNNVNSFVFPGGKVDKGETLESAVAREVQEELAVDVEVVDYLGAVKKYIHGYKIRLHYFKIDVFGDPCIQEHQQHSNLQYVALEASDNNFGFACKLEGIITDNEQDIKTAFVDMYLLHQIVLKHGNNNEALTHAPFTAPDVCNKDTQYVQYLDTQSSEYFMVPLEEYEELYEKSLYNKIVVLDNNELPLELPDVESYEPTGTEEGPLAAIDEWMYGTLADGRAYRRESNTMPQWAGSSWYWLRYMDPRNKDALVDPSVEQYWGQVDVYVGGMEHATRHLIYARFWHKFLYDIGVVSTSEPFKKLRSQGLIMAEDGRKMSKRRGNVINPDDVIADFGADTFRVYEMFMGPFENAVAWSTAGVKGVKGFLDKVVKAFDRVSDTADKDATLESLLHKTIKKVTEDVDNFKFNTAISQMMVFINAAIKCESIAKAIFEPFVVLLAPFAPHLAEELWEQMGNSYSVFTTSTWPSRDESLLVEETINMAVQINGKVRDTIQISPEASEEEVIEVAKASEKVQKYLNDVTIRKVIYVPGKILNIVVG